MTAGKGTEAVRIIQQPGEKVCKWHGSASRIYSDEDILPHGVCPWLYHSVYSYFLGLLYGAKFDYNAEGDCHVCCPAAEGVDTVVRKRENDGSYDPRIGMDMKFVIFAEVVAVRGECPYEHAVGERIPFPTCMPQHFMCPAAFNNLFPLLHLQIPSCIDTANVRCPDWMDTIRFSL